MFSNTSLLGSQNSETGPLFIVKVLHSLCAVEAHSLFFDFEQTIDHIKMNKKCASLGWLISLPGQFLFLSDTLTYRRQRSLVFVLVSTTQLRISLHSKAPKDQFQAT
jgi:hypothetical protein